MDTKDVLWVGGLVLVAMMVGATIPTPELTRLMGLWVAHWIARLQSKPRSPQGFSYNRAMMHTFQEGQRVYSAREHLFGVLTSGPRLPPSAMRPGLNPPHDPDAIPSYDVKFDNDARSTVPANRLNPVLRLEPEPVALQLQVNRWAPFRERAKKNWLPITLLASLGAVVPFADHWAWVTKNSTVLGFWVGIVGTLAAVASLFRR